MSCSRRVSEPFEGLTKGLTYPSTTLSCCLDKPRWGCINAGLEDSAGLTQLVEYQLPKLRVAGSNPVSRSEIRQ